MMRVGAVALGLVATASMARAQMGSPVSFGIVGGATLPTGDLSDAAKTGWHAGGAVQFSVPMIPVGLRADVMYHHLGLKDATQSIEGTTLTEKFSMITGTLNGMFMVPMAAGGMVKPYVIAGVGAYNLRSSVDCSGSCTGIGTASDNSTKFGLNGGAGVQFGLAGLSTFVEARYHHVFSGSDGGGTVAIIPITVGIMFR
ncbi:MAG: outer membrane protein [Gemmatimonadaceae bacterium]